MASRQRGCSRAGAVSAFHDRGAVEPRVAAASACAPPLNARSLDGQRVYGAVATPTQNHGFRFRRVLVVVGLAIGGQPLHQIFRRTEPRGPGELKWTASWHFFSR